MQTRFPEIMAEQYIIMPNHIHLLLVVTEREGQDPPLQRASVIDAVRTLKSGTARASGLGGELWQRSFHDHVIRNEADALRIRQYILSNPLKWKDDCFYPPNPPGLV